MKKPLLSTFAFLCFSLSFTAVSAQHCHPSFQFATNGLVATFENQSTADGTITAYSWDFGDGQTSVDQNPIHAYGQDGTYNVCLTITAHEPNCTETFCHHVVVHHLPADTCQAAFLFHQPHPGAPVDFTDQSSSDDVIGSWAWNFGDGSTSSEQNPSHTYAVPGTYLVCLTITDADGGCTSHFCHEVVAHHPPVGVCQASFIFHQPHPGAPVDFTDQSSSDGVIGSWAWDFGDGSTSSEQNPSHTYAVPGTYLVCLTITDADGGCTSHFCHEVVAHHALACHAAFVVHTESDNHSFQFTNTSAGTTNQTTYSWDFGDGTTSTEQNPHHTYTHLGHYTVCLFITDVATGCSSHICHTITVYHLTDHPHYARAADVGERANSEAGPAFATSADNSVRLENYPNPFSNVTTIHYHLTAASTVRIELYDLSGKKMIELAESSQTAGEHLENLRVEQLLPGNYLLKMTVNEKTYVRQVSVQ